MKRSIATGNLLMLASIALGAAGQPGLAIGLGLLVLVNAALLFVFGHGALKAVAGMDR